MRARGYTLRARNFRSPAGEIDIVAEERGHIVFVEVKTRRGLRYGTPAQSVNLRKRKKIIQTARWYLYSQGMEDRPCRFDVIEVYATEGHNLRIRQICGAFEV